MEEHVLLTSQIRTTQYSERDMEPDLLKCVQTYAGKPTAQNSAFRQCRLIYWADRAKTLRNDNSFGEYYDEHHPARAIAERINVPVVEEILHAMGAATNGVKNEFVHRLGFGFPVVDDLREEGVFDVRPLSRSAKKEFIETKAALIHKQHPLLRSLRRQCIRDGNWKEIADQLQIEVEKGWLQGPYTVHDLPVDHFIPIRRFIVVQGEKHRGCDNGRATNKVTRVHTPISLLGIDNAIATAASMIEHGVEHLSQAVLDQSDAYKSLIADSTQQRYAVVVALNATTQELECYLSNVLCFGTESAVLDYNCLSRFVTAAARRIMGIPAAGYFDDFHMLARADDIEGMAEDFQFFFSNIIGLIFKDAKKRTGQMSALAYPTGSEVIQMLTDAMERAKDGSDKGIRSIHMPMKRKLEALEAASPMVAREMVRDAVKHLKVSSVKGETWYQYFRAVRSWSRYANAMCIAHFPIDTTELEGYVSLHTNADTAECSLSALEKVQRYLRIDSRLRTKGVQEAIKGIRREQKATHKMDPITSQLLDKILADTKFSTPSKSLLREFNALAVLSYVFLLRTNNEALPLCRGLETDAPHSALHDVKTSKRHSSVFRFQQELHIVLASRKSKQSGEVLTRGCTCKATTVTVGWRSMCPVHYLWPFIQNTTEPGRRVFQLTYPIVLENVKLKADRHQKPVIGWGTHSFRRGAAHDINDENPDLGVLLRAGSWTSGTFKEYIDWSKVQQKGMTQVSAVTDE
ncbi:hypothetical protein DIPPA_03165 [Diplonema papillatum]|nr:hypothetical protein DIPPA_03165 [Diplonema papillatum]